MVAAIAGAYDVLRLDKYHTAEMRCNLVNYQLNAKFYTIGRKMINLCKLPVVSCIAESLKTHEVGKLESDHFAMLICELNVHGSIRTPTSECEKWLVPR